MARKKNFFLLNKQITSNLTKLIELRNHCNQNENISAIPFSFTEAKDLRIKTDKDTLTKLDECCKITNLNRSEFIRRNICEKYSARG